MTNDLHRNLKDLTHLRWDERTNTSGTGGTFLKSKSQTPEETTYYKLSCYDSYRGVYGHECVNELIASRLMEALGVEHLRYRLVHARVVIDSREHETWASASPSFRRPDERKQALDLFYDLNKHEGESPLELCRRYGWQRRIDEIMGVDYLIANRDRHGANIEVLRDEHGGLRLAPVFDSGLSLAFSTYGNEDRIAAVDPLADVNANNYLGTRSLEKNLGLIERPLGWSLSETDVDAVLEGLDGIISDAHIGKIRDIITLRWARLAERGLVHALTEE